MEVAVDHYGVLNLPSDEKSADLMEEDISTAYKKMALRLHPDKNPNEPNATANFQKLLSSYEILKDPETRKQFDDMLRSKRQQKAEHDHRQKAEYERRKQEEEAYNFEQRKAAAAEAENVRMVIELIEKYNEALKRYAEIYKLFAAEEERKKQEEKAKKQKRRQQRADQKKGKQEKAPPEKSSTKASAPPPPPSQEQQRRRQQEKAAPENASTKASAPPPPPPPPPPFQTFQAGSYTEILRKLQEALCVFVNKIDEFQKSGENEWQDDLDMKILRN